MLYRFLIQIITCMQKRGLGLFPIPSRSSFGWWQLRNCTWVMTHDRVPWGRRTLSCTYYENDLKPASSFSGWKLFFNGIGRKATCYIKKKRSLVYKHIYIESTSGRKCLKASAQETSHQACNNNLRHVLLPPLPIDSHPLWFSGVHWCGFFVLEDFCIFLTQ
jgi:hypothetical protein